MKLGSIAKRGASSSTNARLTDALSRPGVGARRCPASTPAGINRGGMWLTKNRPTEPLSHSVIQSSTDEKTKKCKSVVDHFTSSISYILLVPRDRQET